MVMHAERRRLLSSPALHRVVAAGRRSGKTEDLKRIAIMGDEHHPGALTPPDVPNPRFVLGGPTHDQAKRVFWDDIKALSPDWAVTDISESELLIRYVTGSVLQVVGLDRPQRIEGLAIDGLGMDESQVLKPDAWSSSLFPTLTNRGRPPGWSMRIGRPKGRNHFFDWFNASKDGGATSDSFHWFSSVVLPPEQIEAARRELDLRTFQQEYEAAFLSQTGLVYYAFDRAKHCRDVRYQEGRTLLLAFDFNVSPGSAVIMQEQDLRPWNDAKAAPHAHTCVIGEVNIESESRTDLVCRQIIERFGMHNGAVEVYGDPSGNAADTRGKGNDWQIVRDELAKRWSQVAVYVPRAAPGVVDSANSVCARMENAAGLVRFAINPSLAPCTVRDFESVAWHEDKAERKIDKSDLRRTHWSDSVRYYVHHRHEMGGTVTRFR